MLLAAFLSLAAPAAFADPSPEVQKMTGDDCAHARKAGKTCVLDMGSEAIDGEAPAGDGIASAMLVFGTMKSLIHVRMDFIPEILRTAEDLD